MSTATIEPGLSPALSMYKLRDDLLSLMELRAEAAAEADRSGAVFMRHPPGNGAGDAFNDLELMRANLAVIDEQIALYIQALPAKIDSVRFVWKRMVTLIAEADAEAKFQSARKRTMEADLERLKQYCQRVMEIQVWQPGQVRKLIGRTGAIYLKANGGRAAVEVQNPDLVPSELMRVQAEMSGDTWDEIIKAMGSQWIREHVGDVRMSPSLVLIGDKLNRDEPVAGCRLSERGSHVEIR